MIADTFAEPSVSPMRKPVFDPVEDISFDKSNEQFSSELCPWIRIAARIMQMQVDGVCGVADVFISNEKDPDGVEDIIVGLEDAEACLRAWGAVIEAARLRLTVCVGYRLGVEFPD